MSERGDVEDDDTQPITFEEATAGYDAELDDPKDENAGEADDSDRVEGGDEDE